jgi:hypothetical protein
VSKDDLVSIDVRSGVNEKGEGFCTIVASGGDGRMLLGQMPPALIRKIALDYFEAAEAAETDAIVYRLLRDKFDLPIAAVGAFVTAMREERDAE